MFVLFVPLQSSCAKTGVDWSCEKSRVALHHFSHSSIKQRLCNLQKSLQEFTTSLLFEVPLTSVSLEYKWFVQPKLHEPIDFPHALHSLSFAFFFCTCLLKGAATGCRPAPLQDAETFKGNAFKITTDVSDVVGSATP